MILNVVSLTLKAGLFRRHNLHPVSAYESYLTPAVNRDLGNRRKNGKEIEEYISLKMCNVMFLQGVNIINKCTKYI